ncbi:hypothetical protein ACFL5O_12000 [Myxococcota bacterium]
MSRAECEELRAPVIAVLWPFLGSSKTIAFFGCGAFPIVPVTIGLMGALYLFWAGLGGAGLLGKLFAV